MNDPKREYCSCGYSFIPSTFMKIILLLHGSYTVKCPRCQTELILHLSHFVYVKERRVHQDKMIWRRG